MKKENQVVFDRFMTIYSNLSLLNAFELIKKTQTNEVLVDESNFVEYINSKKLDDYNYFRWLKKQFISDFKSQNLSSLSAKEELAQEIKLNEQWLELKRLIFQHLKAMRNLYLQNENYKTFNFDTNQEVSHATLLRTFQVSQVKLATKLKSIMLSSRLAIIFKEFDDLDVSLYIIQIFLNQFELKMYAADLESLIPGKAVYLLNPELKSHNVKVLLFKEEKRLEAKLWDHVKLFNQIASYKQTKLALWFAKELINQALGVHKNLYQVRFSHDLKFVQRLEVNLEGKTYFLNWQNTRRLLLTFPWERLSAKDPKSFGNELKKIIDDNLEQADDNKPKPTPLKIMLGRFSANSQIDTRTLLKSFNHLISKIDQKLILSNVEFEKLYQVLKHNNLNFWSTDQLLQSKVESVLNLLPDELHKITPDKLNQKIRKWISKELIKHNSLATEIYLEIPDELESQNHLTIKRVPKNFNYDQVFNFFVIKKSKKDYQNHKVKRFLAPLLLMFTKTFKTNNNHLLVKEFADLKFKDLPITHSQIEQIFDKRLPSEINFVILKYFDETKKVQCEIKMDNEFYVSQNDFINSRLFYEFCQLAFSRTRAIVLDKGKQLEILKICDFYLKHKYDLVEAVFNLNTQDKLVEQKRIFILKGLFSKLSSFAEMQKIVELREIAVQINHHNEIEAKQNKLSTALSSDDFFDHVDDEIKKFYN